MKRILSALALAVATISASAAPVVTPGTFTILGFEQPGVPGAGVIGNGQTVQVGLGGVVAEFENPETFDFQRFVAYCVELFSPAGDLFAPYQYNKIEITQTDFAGALEPSNITALSKLFTANAGPTTLTATQSAGMQLAVWELLYDGEGGSLADGNFRAGNSPMAAVDWATSILATAQTSQANYSITLFSDEEFNLKPNNQNFITATFNAGGSCELGNNCEVPEPGALALAGLGLGALALTRRRKTAVKA